MIVRLLAACRSAPNRLMSHLGFSWQWVLPSLASAISARRTQSPAFSQQSFVQSAGIRRSILFVTRATASLPSICIWICSGWLRMSELLYLVWPQRDGQSCTLLDTSTTDTLALNHDFFRPLGMQHFYDSFALVWSTALVWLKRRWTPAWPAHHQR